MNTLPLTCLAITHRILLVSLSGLSDAEVFVDACGWVFCASACVVVDVAVFVVFAGGSAAVVSAGALAGVGAVGGTRHRICSG